MIKIVEVGPRDGLQNETALLPEKVKIAVFAAASETFNRKNINASIGESIERFKPVTQRARNEGLPIRGHISTAFWCVFEGKIEKVHRCAPLSSSPQERCAASDTRWAQNLAFRCARVCIS